MIKTQQDIDKEQQELEEEINCTHDNKQFKLRRYTWTGRFSCADGVFRQELVPLDSVCCKECRDKMIDKDRQSLSDL
jgi:hypothetical protein